VPLRKYLQNHTVRTTQKLVVRRIAIIVISHAQWPGLAPVSVPSVRQAADTASALADLPTPFSSWSHEKGVPGKVIAQLMGHANVDTTLNVYTQVLDGSARTAAEKVGSELITIVHNLDSAATARTSEANDRSQTEQAGKAACERAS